MNAAERHHQKYPSARASSLIAQARKEARTEQLKREIEAKAAGHGIPVLDAEPPKPRRLKYSLIFMPWHWRFG
jgi:hypothetical protein